MRGILLVACILAGLGPGRAAADTQVNETRSAPEAGVVSIHNINGSIHVTGWSRKEVHVTGTLGPAVEKLQFESEGDRTRIVVKTPDHVKDGKSIESRLEVSVPKGSDVRVEGVNLEIAVGGVAGELELQSVNGGVIANGQPEEIHISTVNGTITLNAAARKTHVEAVNGSVEVTGGKGELEASCVNGRIEVREGTFEEASCSTVSGDRFWSAGLAPRASLALESHSGSVTLELPRSTSAEFDVSTFSGKIENGLGPSAKRSSEYGPGYQLHFDLGSGSSNINVSSFSGNVTIRAK
jgi:DUF4097 and DUF4098 domain-containing protein YvlB